MIDSVDEWDEAMNKLNLNSLRQKKKKIRVKSVSENEIVGLEDLEKEFYSFELQCNSGYGEVLAIEKSLYYYKIAHEQYAKNYATQVGSLHENTNSKRINFFKNNISKIFKHEEAVKPNLQEEQSHSDFIGVSPFPDYP